MKIVPLAIAGLLFLQISDIAEAHEFVEQDVSFAIEVAELSGTLVIPEHNDNFKDACVVILGGTLSNTRDGE